MTFDEYYHANRKAGEPDQSFLRGFKGGRRGKATIKQYEAEVTAKYDEKDRLREEYELLVASGTIKPPTQIEQLKKVASLNTDSPQVQAAKRALAKRAKRFYMIYGDCGEI